MLQASCLDFCKIFDNVNILHAGKMQIGRQGSKVDAKMIEKLSLKRAFNKLIS